MQDGRSKLRVYSGGFSGGFLRYLAIVQQARASAALHPEKGFTGFLRVTGPCAVLPAGKIEYDGRL